MTTTLLAVVQLLQGTVLSSETQLPIGFSVVNLAPTGGKQFTDGAGRFTFANVQAGTYVLSIRQIGYTPLDTQLVLTGHDTTAVRVALRRLAIELPPVTVIARQCTNPGRPDSSDRALLAVFDQLQENARRFELLADSYPFRYVLELSQRTVSLRGDTGRLEVQRLQFSSDDNHPYAVGRVVEPGWGPWAGPGVLVIHSADLQDLGNSTFITNHCFWLAGRDTIAGDSLIRIDFDPGPRISSADMRGAAYLDPVTYELRYTTTSLTRPERSALTDVSAMTFRTRFRNIAPGVPLQDSLAVVTTYRYGRRAKIDTQRTVDVRFRRGALRAPR